MGSSRKSKRSVESVTSKGIHTKAMEVIKEQHNEDYQQKSKKYKAQRNKASFQAAGKSQLGISSNVNNVDLGNEMNDGEINDYKSFNVME